MGKQMDLEIEEAFVVNLKLLKFPQSQLARSHKVTLKNEMFRTPNKVGYECVLYFLFKKLDSDKCDQVFRTCWQIHDLKQAAEFRKNCGLWITEIADREPNTYLPKLPGPILVSPYGSKFYWLVCKLSSYVLQKLGPPPEIFGSNMNPIFVDLFQKLALASIKRNQSLYYAKLEQHKTWVKEYQEVVNLNLEFAESLKKEQLELKTKIAKAQNELGNLDAINSINGEEILDKLKRRWDFIHQVLKKEENCADFIPSVLSCDSENLLDFQKLNLVISEALLERGEEVGLEQEDIANLYDKERKVNLKSYIRICNATLKLHLLDIKKFLSNASGLNQSLDDHLKSYGILNENMKELLEKLLSLKSDLIISIEKYTAILAKHPQTSQFFVDYDKLPLTPSCAFKFSPENDSKNVSLFDFDTPQSTPFLKKIIFERPDKCVEETPVRVSFHGCVETPPLSYTPWQRSVFELSTPKESHSNIKCSASKCFDLPQELPSLTEHNNLDQFPIFQNKDEDSVVSMDNFLEKILDDISSKHRKSFNSSIFLDSLTEEIEEESLGLLNSNNFSLIDSKMNF